MVQLDKKYYNSILSATFSPCGEYFVAGNIFGDIRLFNFTKLLNNAEEEISDNNNKISKNRFNFNTTFQNEISCLLSSEKFCIGGINGEIFGWQWTDVIGLENGNTVSNPSWKISLPQSSENANIKNELNCMKIEAGDDVLYVGCSNNNIYAFSLEDGKLLKTFFGHTDYVHCLDTRDNMLISGGEDGTVRMWDCRTKEVTNILKPHTNAVVARPELGHWIGDVSLNEDWMLCGGGARMSLWNLRNMDCPMTTFCSTKDRGIQISQFYQDRIFAGGYSSCLSVLSYNDELHTSIESSSNPIYSCNVITPKDTNKVLCLTGSGNKIDISTNFNYREYVIPFY